MASATGNLVPLETVLRTEELAQRPSRGPDYARENRALLALAQALAESPQSILQKLVEIALEVLDAGSAGVSVRSGDADGGQSFRWPAIAGAWSMNIGGDMPRLASPCSVAVERGAVQLFALPERRFPNLTPLGKPIREALLAPFYVDGKAVGTVWAIAHDEDRKFDAEDARMLESLGKFASGAYQVLRSAAAEQDHATLIAREARLKETTEQLQAALAVGSLGTWRWDPKNNLAELDVAFRQMIGLPIDERPITPEQFLTVIHPDDQPRLAEYIDRTRSELSRVDIEYRVHVPAGLPGGEVRWLLTRGSPVVDEQGQATGILGATMDITDRKRAEQSLARELENTQLLAELSTRLSAQDDTPVLLQSILGAAITILGADMGTIQLFDPQSEVLRIQAHTDLPPDFVKFFYEIYPTTDSCCGRCLQTDRRTVVTEVETSSLYDEVTRQVVLAAGVRAVQATPLVARSGARLGMITTHWRRPYEPPEHELRLLDLLARQAADLIERTRTEELVRQSEERYRLLFDRSPLASVVIDAETLRFVVANEAAIKLYGYTEEEFLALTLLDIRPPEDVAIARQLLANLPATGRLVDVRKQLGASELHRHQRKDGTLLYVDPSFLEIDYRGRRAWLAIIADVTERKAAEQALRDADRRKDEFLATLAHELRNPLAPIRNGLELMKLAEGNPQTISECRDIMERQLTQMVRLIDDLMDLSRISRGKVGLRKERIALAKIVEQAVETSRPLIEADRHQLSILHSPEPLVVDGDGTRLSQVIANLLNNAAKYTPSSGRITLAVQRQADQAVVSVRDSGVGIPADMLPKVFDMFTQVNSSLERTQGGLGIGLSLVKGLVEMHGGSVEAHSAGAGLGSEFIVRLPLAITAEIPARPTAGDCQSRRAPGRRILVVDDNRDAAASLAMMLSAMGNQTAQAYDGLEALRLGETFLPELIFLDIGMPNLNGYDVAQRIRQLPWGQHLLLVALTGWGQEEYRQRSREAGFDHHLVKPIDFAALDVLLARSRVN